MRKISIGAFSSTAAVLFLVASPAAAFTIQTKVDAGADAHYIRPYIRVAGDNSTPTELNGLTLNYYVYEKNLPVFFNPPTTTTAGVSLSVSRAPQTFTGVSKNANYVVQIRITSSVKVTATQFFDIQFSLQASDNRTFTQTDDWSYLNVPNYTLNNAITLTDDFGNLKAGVALANDRNTVLAKAKDKIKHIVIIMQENRSFDHYFGTYPGADGVVGIGTKPYSCVKSDGTTLSGTYGPSHVYTTQDGDYPHFYSSAMGVLNAGGGTGDLAIDSYLKVATDANVAHCSDAALAEVVGYHDATEIPNYWKLAQNFVLQDQMFEAAPSWSKISHLYMVSGWSAQCTPNQTPIANNHDPFNPYACTNSIGDATSVTMNDGTSDKYYLWEDITNRLRWHQPNRVTWKYYLGENWNHTCQQCSSTPKDCITANDTTVNELWNPLLYFRTVKDNGERGNIQKLSEAGAGFYDDVAGAASNFPSVSWIVPGKEVSEHADLTNFGLPDMVDIKAGQAYVTSIIQAIMRNAALWESTAIFLSWDDWGGFYDHKRPPPIDGSTTGNGYGIRVPGMTISPWVQQVGYIDSKVLSHDAYLKLIEDIFLDGQSIGPLESNRPYPRREDVSQLGDLLDEFDFNRNPVQPSAAVTDLPCRSDANAAPFVDAGVDKSVVLPSTVTLDATVIDDGLTASNPSLTWTKLIGPGTVTFNSANPACAAASCQVSSVATFSAAGVYVLRLNASDGALNGSDSVQVTVTGAGSGGTSPCANLCSSPTVFSVPAIPGGNYQSGNLGTGTVCRETTSVINGGNCGNFIGGRTLTVNGTTMTCNNGNWSGLPAKRNNGYCVQTTAGNQAFAYFTMWY